MFGLNRKKIFSIIIPVNNGEKTLERTLASFISSKDYIKHVIIVDDCSTDNTEMIVNKWKEYNFFKIIYTKNDNIIGPGASRKNGMKLAVSEWITFVDADDCLTPGCLKYVYDNIIGNKDVVIIHSKTIYYESGTFNAKSINYSDTSCGGNFYKRKYLINNNLYPHDTLPLVEDQYFNEKIIYHINYIDNSEVEKIGYFDYPTYEVHHDEDFDYSYAVQNWEDYCVKYRLIYKQYLTNDFIKDANEKDNYDLYSDIVISYIRNFIFCFYLAVGLQFDEDIEFDFQDEENKELFKDSLIFYWKTIERDPFELIDYHENKNNEEIINDIISVAYDTLGFKFDINQTFASFVKEIIPNKF